MIRAYDWVSFTTDYGLADGFVAACHGVLARIAPQLRVIDISHQIPAQDMRCGAAVLAQTVGSLPTAVHLAVVDPGVGTARRGIVLTTPNGALVGPDNGLLLPAARALGGLLEAHELTEPRYRAPVVTATFHGRDIFAPAAAYLASGVPATEFGPRITVESLVHLQDPVVQVEPSRLAAEVLTVDSFGNIQLAATQADLARGELEPGRPVTVAAPAATYPAIVGTTFADVAPGELVVYLDSAGYLAVARNRGAAAELLSCRPGETVVVQG